MVNTTRKLAEVFAVLKPDLRVDTIPVSPSVYSELDAKFDQFNQHVLIAEYEFTEDWAGWERHPAGDEIVVLLAGEAEMILRIAGNDERLALSQAGQYVVVPAGVWHTAKTALKTRMLFITPGQGTEHCSGVDRAP